MPAAVKRKLLARKTNIVAYELLAALVALLSLCPRQLEGRRVVHFIDNTAAMSCVLKGFSRQHDLSLIAGRLWYEVSVMMLDYSELLYRQPLTLLTAHPGMM